MGTHHETAPKILSPSFFQRPDTLAIARELLGKFLFSAIGGTTTGGMIVETEAYLGAEDRACHAYNNRRTRRTETMFRSGGHAYVYLCYGIHALLNVVTHEANFPHAILIRALQPTHGLDLMEKRRGSQNLCHGPGALTEALGITCAHTGHPLTEPPLWIEDRGITPSRIETTPRIGVDYAGEDAKLPYRFLLS